MASLPNTKTVAYEEWLRMPEVTDAIEEVVNGEIRMMPPAKWKHALPVTSISKSLESQIDMDKALVISTSFGLVIRKSPLTSRVPDIAVFELESMVEQDGYIHSAPQLVVEVLSPANTRREREEKLGDYAAIGVPEVWVVSPEARTVEVLYLEDGFPRTVMVLNQGNLQPKRFPRVQVPVPAIWPD
jgi:Uma2 family endonuclease